MGAWLLRIVSMCKQTLPGWHTEWRDALIAESHSVVPGIVRFRGAVVVVSMHVSAAALSANLFLF
jgi:hypothetical protein